MISRCALLLTIASAALVLAGCPTNTLSGTGGSSAGGSSPGGTSNGNGGTNSTRYDLTTDVEGRGSILLSPSGASYDTGQRVQLTADPDCGFALEHWEGDVSGSSSTTSVLMDRDREVTAVFRVPAASSPSPADGATDVQVRRVGERYVVDLQWSGNPCVTFYVGLSQVLPIPDEYYYWENQQWGQPAFDPQRDVLWSGSGFQSAADRIQWTTVTTNSLSVLLDESVVNGTTIYWRVGSHHDNDRDGRSGPLWSFTTASGSSGGPSTSPLVPGMYTGDGSGNSRITIRGQTESVPYSSPYQIRISENGLPLMRRSSGPEFREGASDVVRLAGFDSSVMVTEVTMTSNAVLVYYTAQATLQGTSIFGFGSERFENRGSGELYHHATMTLADSGNQFILVVELSGTLHN